jgi:hypothetical protein
MQNERLAIPQSALNLPHWNWPPVARVDNVFVARNPVCRAVAQRRRVCSCVGMEAYQSNG